MDDVSLATLTKELAVLPEGAHGSYWHHEILHPKTLRWVAGVAQYGYDCQSH